jgi:threonine aldolase
MHLDGARLHKATAFTNATVKEYASYFDTVYMCMYKYLGATGGGIFTNWPSAAIAFHHLNTIDEVMAKIKTKSADLFNQFTKLKEIKVTPLFNGTNQFNVSLSKKIDPVKLNSRLRGQHNIVFGQPREDGFVKIKVNPTLLRRDNKLILESFQEAIEFAKT